MNAQRSSSILVFGLMRKHPRLSRLFSTCLILLMLLPYPPQLRAFASWVDSDLAAMLSLTELTVLMEQDTMVLQDSIAGQDSMAEQNSMTEQDHSTEQGSSTDQMTSSGMDCCDETDSKAAPASPAAPPSPASHSCCEPAEDLTASESHKTNHRDSNPCSGASFCQCSHDQPQPHVSILPPPLAQGSLKIVSYLQQPFFPSEVKNTLWDDTTHLHPVEDLFLMHDRWLI